MAVGLTTWHYFYTVGHPDFLHSFFSSIAVNLEQGRWGSRFPHIMRSLYQGELPAGDVVAAEQELATITDELSKLGPDRVVWDIEDRSKQPPWGDNIAPTITNMANYYVTSEGSDLIEVIGHAFADAKEMGEPVKIRNMNQGPPGSAFYLGADGEVRDLN